MADAPTPAATPMTFEEFFQSAQPDAVMTEVVAELRQEREASPVDQDTSRMNVTWSLLANQVVGQESF